MTLEKAQIVFNQLISTYFSVRQEITTYRDCSDGEERNTNTVCELYTEDIDDEDGTKGAWLSGDTWEILIQLFLDKKQEQEYNGK